MKRDFPPYTYNPLPTSSSIRLLRFPRLDPTTDKISTTFRIVDLAQNPLYHALSYTWGNPLADGPFFAEEYSARAHRYASQDSILVDGHLLPVNRNLHDALLSMKPDAWRRYCNSRTKRMRSQLHLAVLLRKASDVRALVRSKVDLDLVDDAAGATPLMYAAANGEEEIVKILLCAGAAVGVINSEGATAAHIARRNGWSKIAIWIEDAQMMGPDERRQVYGEDTGQDQSPDYDGPDSWIWIDQLCINQEDLEERGHQVSMMGEIYSSAFWMLVWLGAKDEHTNTAIQAVKKLADANGDLINSTILPYVEQAEEVYYAADIPYISPNEWQALASLFLRQYFRRMWVVQENILSQTTLGLCGDIEVPWRALCTVAQQLYLRQLKIGVPTGAKYIHHTEAAHEIELHASQLVQWKDRWVNEEHAANPEAFGLTALVRDYRTFNASNPKDKIFGFFGLLNLLENKMSQDPGRSGGALTSRGLDTGGQGSTLSRKVWIADYTKSTAQVFAEATKGMINETGNLGVLANVFPLSSQQTTGLPSWSPDFSIPFANTLPVPRDAYNSNERDFLARPLSASSPWAHLPVLVRPLDRILQCDSRTTSGPGDTVVFFSHAWISLTLLLPTPYHDTGLSRTEVLWRTLTADAALNGAQPAPMSYGNAFRDLVSTMVCIAAQQEARQFQRLAGMGKILCLPASPTPSLKAAVEHVWETWQNPALAQLGKDDLRRQFGEVGHNLSGGDWEALVFSLMGLHVLALTEWNEEPEGEAVMGQRRTTSRLFTPTLNQLQDFEQEMDWGGKENDGCGRVKLHDHVTDLSQALRRTLGRRRLFVTDGRLLGVGPAGMNEDDVVVTMKGFNSPAVLRKAEAGTTCDKNGDDFTQLNGRSATTCCPLGDEGCSAVTGEQWHFLGPAFIFGLNQNSEAQKAKRFVEIVLV